MTSDTFAGPAPVTYTASSETEDVTTHDFGKRPVLVTTVIVTLLTLLGNLAFYVGLLTKTIDNLVFWPPIFAAVVSGVALVSFGGYYAASRRVRSAMAASVLSTFMVLLVFSLTIRALNDAAAQAFATALVDDFRSIVLAVVGFYFGTETVVTVSKIIAVRGADPALRQTLGRIDRDLPGTGG